MSDERKRLGARGERMAEKFLRHKGFRTVARNLKRKAGELDLLMWDGPELVVIEVRTVHTLGEFDPADKVPPSKQKQVIRVTEHLLAELPTPLPVIRFDVCVVVLDPKPVIHHYLDAFRPGNFSHGR